MLSFNVMIIRISCEIVWTEVLFFLTQGFLIIPYRLHTDQGSCCVCGGKQRTKPTSPQAAPWYCVNPDNQGSHWAKLRPVLHPEARFISGSCGRKPLIYTVYPFYSYWTDHVLNDPLWILPHFKTARLALKDIYWSNLQVKAQIVSPPKQILLSWKKKNFNFQNVSIIYYFKFFTLAYSVLYYLVI